MCLRTMQPQAQGTGSRGPQAEHTGGAEKPSAEPKGPKTYHGLPVYTPENAIPNLSTYIASLGARLLSLQDCIP